jgi:hypothetical protein
VNRRYHVYRYEHIDDLQMMWEPGAPVDHDEECIFTPHDEGCVGAAFKAAGWEGDGKIRLIWLPPFVFTGSRAAGAEGEIIWHVKQKNNGTSFIASRWPLPFEELKYGFRGLFDTDVTPIYSASEVFEVPEL